MGDNKKQLSRPGEVSVTSVTVVGSNKARNPEEEL